MAALQALATVVSLFVKSDGGLSAMLSNVRELQGETVKLLQDVIGQLGEIQASLANMPMVVREQLVLHAADGIKEKLTAAADDLRFCDAQRAKGQFHRDIMERALTNCHTTASSYRAVPYGVGGTAAVCAPLFAAMDARIRTLLGRRSEIRDAMQTYYLPWLTAIQSDENDG